MMTKALAPAFVALAVVYVASVLIATSAIASHPMVAIAIAFDLTITATLAFWWLAGRPGHAQPKSLIRVAPLGFVIAKFVVGLGALGMVGALAELIVLIWLGIRIRRIARRTREMRRLGHSLPASLETAFVDTLGVRAVSSMMAI